MRLIVLVIAITAGLFINQCVTLGQDSKIDYLKDEWVSYTQDPNFFANFSVELYWKLRGVRLGAKDEFETQAEYQARVNKQAEYQEELNMTFLREQSSIIRTYGDIPLTFPSYNAEKQEFNTITLGFSTSDHTINKGFESGKTGPSLKFLSSMENSSAFSNHYVANGGIYNSYSFGLWLTPKMSSNEARNMKDEVAPTSSSSNLLLSIDFIIEADQSPAIQVIGARLLSARTRQVLYTWGQSKKRVGETEVSKQMEGVTQPVRDTHTISKTKSSSSQIEDPRDGKKYDIIQIGKQIWMAENLTFKSKSGCWAYDNNSTNAQTFGYLYEWEEAKKVCPVGWHLPSDAEWTQLINSLGGMAVAGNKLKAVGISHWKSPNKVATNESGFTALPGGFRSYDGVFSTIGTLGLWWSATEIDASLSWYLQLSYTDGSVYRTSGHKKGCFSVRCIKDN
jgi:uncharacterized protein (TIGR02145 family)